MLNNNIAKIKAVVGQADEYRHIGMLDIHMTRHTLSLKMKGYKGWLIRAVIKDTGF